MELLVAVLSFILLIASSGGKEFSGLPSNVRLPKAPAAGLCAHLIEPAGYPCSEHITQTKDGYLLGLQRVSASSSSSRLGCQNGQRGPPVLLLHGLMMSGDASFLDSMNQSLGFILADNGFDVWAGNVRGTRWSHGHVFLSERENVYGLHQLGFAFCFEFWDWSWQELALYDLAEMTHYISNVTNTKVFIVGHSQGTIMSLAALTQPDLAAMVEAAAFLCPISYLNRISSEFVLRLVKMHMDDVFLAMGIHELNFKSDMSTQLMDMICDGHVNCNDLLGAITGKNCCFNDSRIDFYLEYEPHPTSAKNLHHLFQMIRKGTFKMYDYGFWKKFLEYGSFQPPRFDLRNIPESLPLWMGYGGNDALADVTDVRRTLKELKGKPELLYLEEYGHIDFLLSVSSKKHVYDDMIRFFKNLSGRYTSY